MVRMDDAFDAEDEHVRFAAYRRAVDGGEPLEGILDQLANDPGQVMADSVRTRLLDRATTRDAVTGLLAQPGFSSRAVLRKAEDGSPFSTRARRSPKSNSWPLWRRASRRRTWNYWSAETFPRTSSSPR